MQDARGDLLPEVEDAVTGLITAAVWFGITAGYLTLTSSCSIPHRFLHRSRARQPPDPQLAAGVDYIPATSPT